MSDGENTTNEDGMLKDTYSKKSKPEKKHKGFHIIIMIGKGKKDGKA